MEHTEVSLKTRQRRKFLLVLPGLVVPFLLIIFIALGGGKGKPSAGVGSVGTEGLNARLPEAHFAPGKESDKLGVYERMDRDSHRVSLSKRFESIDRLISDSPRLRAEMSKKFGENNPRAWEDREWLGSDSSHIDPSTNTSEKEVMEKLTRLRTLMNDKRLPNKVEGPAPPPPAPAYRKDAAEHSSTKTDDGTQVPDPELDQLNGLLDKIKSVQHPELIADSLAMVQKQHRRVFSVSAPATADEPTVMGNHPNVSIPFFSTENADTTPKGNGLMINAFVAETQTVVSGSTFRLRTIDDALVNGVLVPKNEWIYGIASLRGERLGIQFSSIWAGNRILPIALEAYDLDGLAGLYIPGSFNRDIAKQSADQGIGTLGMAALDPSVAAQATAAGIQTARTLISRKVRLVRVTVPAGYHLLLKQSSDK